MPQRFPLSLHITPRFPLSLHITPPASRSRSRRFTVRLSLTLLRVLLFQLFAALFLFFQHLYLFLLLFYVPSPFNVRQLWPGKECVYRHGCVPEWRKLPFPKGVHRRLTVHLTYL